MAAQNHDQQCYDRASSKSFLIRPAHLRIDDHQVSNLKAYLWVWPLFRFSFEACIQAGCPAVPQVVSRCENRQVYVTVRQERL